MKDFRADLHIHSTLSPCGDLDMHPANIVSRACEMGLDIIGITDHNSTRHCALISRLAAEKGIYTLQGAEVTTREEVHCLAFFENTDVLKIFQVFLDESLPDILNIPELFGDQVQVDEDGNIIYEERKLLVNALNKPIEEVEFYVHSLGGLFIPAHIDRRKNSIYSQLGFLPENLNADALEVSRHSSPEEFGKNHPEIKKYNIISSSDAHFPDSIGTRATNFQLEKPTFGEIRKALMGSDGRRICAL